MKLTKKQALFLAKELGLTAVQGAISKEWYLE